MGALGVALFAVALCTGFVWPRWWLSLAPIGLAVGLITYTVLAGDWKTAPSGDNNGALESALIIAVAVLLEIALFAGSLLRSRYEKRAGRSPELSRASRSTAGIALVTVLFVLAVAMVLGEGGIVLLVLCGAVVAASVWFARRSGASRG